MSDNQQFCLRWNNHQSTLVQVIDSLLSSDRLVDCTLAADGQYLHAHKVVLCACSPYFESLLSQHYEKHPIVILKDVRFEELKATMEYMYKGEVNINQDALGQFLKVAETLQIKGLTDGNIGDDKPSQKRHEAPQVRKPVTHQSRSSVTLPPNSSGLTIEPSKRPLPSHLSDAQPDSPIRSREGSSSPTSRKRRRRRPSQGDEDGHQENSCDLPMQGQTMSITSVPSSIPTLPSGSSSTITKAPPPDDDSENPENDRLSGVTSEGFIKEKIEPQPELLLEPKTEYMEETNNDDSVEDLTLDDDDEYEGMMDSGPGPSHGGNNPNENYAAWQQITGDRQDDSYLNPADGGHRDSQAINVEKSPTDEAATEEAITDNDENVKAELSTTTTTTTMACSDTARTSSPPPQIRVRSDIPNLRPLNFQTLSTFALLSTTNNFHMGAGGQNSMSNTAAASSLMAISQRYLNKLSCLPAMSPSQNWVSSSCDMYDSSSDTSIGAGDHIGQNDSSMANNNSHSSPGSGGGGSRRHNREKEPIFGCLDCGKRYRSKTSLSLHKRLECGKEPAFQCPFCPLKTHQKGNLQVHIKKKHSDPSHFIGHQMS